MTNLSYVLKRKELSVRMEMVTPHSAAFYYPDDEPVGPDEEQERRERLAICLADSDGITGVELAEGRLIVSILENRHWSTMKYNVDFHFRFVYSDKKAETGSTIIDQMVSACFSRKARKAKTKFMEDGTIDRLELYNLADKRMNIVYRRVEAIPLRPQDSCTI